MRKGVRISFLSLAILGIASGVSVTAASFERIVVEPQQVGTKRVIYLDVSNWNANSPKFSCYIWGTDVVGSFANNAFMDHYAGNIYWCTVPAGYTNVLFVRQKTSATEPSFSGDAMWNQTVDMVLTSTYTCFTVQGTSSSPSPSWTYAGDGTKYGGNWSSESYASYSYSAS